MSDFVVGIELGSLRPPAVVAELLTDVAHICEAATRVAQVDAQHSARVEILKLAATEPTKLLQRTEHLGLSELQLSELRDWVDDIRELEHWLPSLPSHRKWRYQSMTASYQVPYEFWIPAAATLLSIRDAEERAGSGPYVERILYENPLEVALAASGGTLLALGWLLTIIRDWGSRQRMAAAAASDLESSAEAKAEFRRIVLERFTRGELVAPLDQIEAALGNAPDVVARLSRLDVRVAKGIRDEDTERTS